MIAKKTRKKYYYYKYPKENICDLTPANKKNNEYNLIIFLFTFIKFCS